MARHNTRSNRKPVTKRDFDLEDGVTITWLPSTRKRDSDIVTDIIKVCLWVACSPILVLVWAYRRLADR